MKQHYISKLAFLLPIAFLTLVFSTSGISAPKTSLSFFLSLHEQYCESDINSKVALIAALNTDKRFKKSKQFLGIYETTEDEISYAVTPEIDGCTVDVLVKDKLTGELLFSYEDMQKALVKKGYKLVGKETTRTVVGLDKNGVKVRQKKFVSPSGKTTELDYPTERPDQYYTTLFTEKFVEEETKSEKSI